MNLRRHLLARCPQPPQIVVDDVAKTANLDLWSHRGSHLEDV